jgi:hypothetical protein
MAAKPSLQAVTERLKVWRCGAAKLHIKLDFSVSAKRCGSAVAARADGPSTRPDGREMGSHRTKHSYGQTTTATCEILSTSNVYSIFRYRVDALPPCRTVSVWCIVWYACYGAWPPFEAMACR